MNKLGNIQSLRGIAAWSVVFYHYAHDYYGMKPESLILKLTLFYGNFGVDLFLSSVASSCTIRLVTGQFLARNS